MCNIIYKCFRSTYIVLHIMLVCTYVIWYCYFPGLLHCDNRANIVFVASVAIIGVVYKTILKQIGYESN